MRTGTLETGAVTTGCLPAVQQVRHVAATCITGIRLNNRLASLRRSVENGDAKPTDGAYKVFGELSAKLDGLLEALDGELTQRLNPLNSRLTGKQLEPVSATVE